MLIKIIYMYTISNFGSVRNEYIYSATTHSIIKSDSKYIYNVTKKLYFKLMLFFWTFFSSIIYFYILSTTTVFKKTGVMMLKIQLCHQIMLTAYKTLKNITTF